MEEFCYIGIMQEKSISLPSHFHQDIIEIVYYFEGEGVLQTGEKTIRFKAGDIICIPAGLSHCDVSESGFKNIYCGFKSKNKRLNDIVIINDNFNQDFRKVLMMILNAYYKQKKNWNMIVSKLLTVLVEYMVTWKIQSTKTYYVDMCENAIIENIPNCNFDINSFLHDIPMSKTHFTRLFKEETGLSPTAYLYEKRMVHAANNLAGISNTYNIKSVSMMCGYNDQYHFSKAFKRKYGVSPKMWKERIQLYESASDSIKLD